MRALDSDSSDGMYPLAQGWLNVHLQRNWISYDDEDSLEEKVF